MSWKQRWQDQDTPWDAGQSAPALQSALRRGLLGERGRALVPGCGSGYDVLALAEAGWDVTGVDLAAGAARRFESLRDERGVEPDHARVLIGDFFELDLGEYDLIWDYTFLCALQPEMRTDWLERTHELVGDDRLLATLIFPITDQRDWDEGPPFRMSFELVRDLVTPSFELVHEGKPETSVPGRKGMEHLAVWRRTGQGQG